MGRGPIRGRRALAASLALAVVLAGCDQQSRIDPEASVTVSGAAYDVDGSPLAGRPVRLGSGVSDGDAALAILTIGVACVSGSCRGDVRDATTGDDGTYRFELTGRDTQSTFGEALSFLVSTSAAPSGSHPQGAAASARLRIQTEAVRVPDLRLVDPGLSVTADAGAVVARWASEPAPGPYTVTFEEPAPIPVWSQETAEPGLVVDARILEDTTGQVVVGGTRRDAVEGSDVTIAWRSPSVGYAGGLGAPPSRGRPCVVLAADGTTRSEAPCTLTDGDLQTGTVPPMVCAEGEQGCAPPSWVRVELAAALPAELVVVRGCRSTCAVRTVAAGADVPTDVGSVTGDLGTVALDGRAVVAVDVAVTEPALREISVWGPAPAREPLRPPGEASGAFGEADADASGEGPPLWLLVAVGAVVVALAGAGGYALARRSRPPVPPPQ